MSSFRFGRLWSRLERGGRKLFSTSSAKQRAFNRIFEPKVLFIQGCILAGGFGYSYYRYKSHLEHQEWQANTSEYVKSTGRPQLGGPFTLVDTSGKPVTEAHFRGKWCYYYFGFNHCPEICPAEMEKMCKVVDAVDAKYGEGTLTPIYISVDPGRDSCKEIADYLKDFSPKFVGLTGTPKQIEQATRHWRVYYNVPDLYESREDYLVDHSIMHYLMSPNLEFVAFFSKEYTVPDITRKVVKHIEAYNARTSPF
eukprot:RCo029069